MLARRSWSMGAMTNAAIGSAAGAAIGSIFPGVGTAIGGLIGGVVGGMIGPSAHYTPGGLLYDTAASDLKQGAIDTAEMYNQWAVTVGRPPVAVPHLSFTSADDPWTGPYLAKLLANPSYASATSPDPLEALQAQGVYDAAIKVQGEIQSVLQQEMASPGSTGTSAVAVPTQAMPADYQTMTGVPPGEIPGSYSAVQASPVASDGAVTAPAPAAAPVTAGFSSPVILVGGIAAFVVFAIVLRRL